MSPDIAKGFWEEREVQTVLHRGPLLQPRGELPHYAIMDFIVFPTQAYYSSPGDSVKLRRVFRFALGALL